LSLALLLTLIMLCTSVPSKLLILSFTLMSMLLRKLINMQPISLRNDLRQAQIVPGSGVADAAPQADQHDVNNLDHDLRNVIKQDVINLDHDLGHVTMHVECLSLVMMRQGLDGSACIANRSAKFTSQWQAACLTYFQ